MSRSAAALIDEAIRELNDNCDIEVVHALLRAARAALDADPEAGARPASDELRRTIGQEIVDTHLGNMNGMSRQHWPAIREHVGFRIIEDRAYQGFDAGIHPWWTEPRFWCRSMLVERIVDGARGWGIGPQNEAYKMAIKKIESNYGPILSL